MLMNEDVVEKNRYFDFKVFGFRNLDLKNKERKKGNGKNLTCLSESYQY
jgi:hypothetical protein